MVWLWDRDTQSRVAITIAESPRSRVVPPALNWVTPSENSRKALQTTPAHAHVYVTHRADGAPIHRYIHIYIDTSDIYIYTYVCIYTYICVCVCVVRESSWRRRRRVHPPECPSSSSPSRRHSREPPRIHPARIPPRSSTAICSPTGRPWKWLSFSPFNNYELIFVMANEGF